MKNVITKVQQTGILSFTHSLSMMGSDTHVVNVTKKQLGRILSNSTWQPNMMENNSGVKNVTTKVFQNIHLSFTHSPSMMGLDAYVANVAIKQLRSRISKPIS